MLRKFDKSLPEDFAQSLSSVLSELHARTLFVRDLWFKRHLSVVDEFSAEQIRDRYVSWGLDPAKVTHVTNGQPDYSQGRVDRVVREKRNRFGFFGQLVDNKGAWVLLRAVQQLRSEGFKDFVVEINGDNMQYGSAERRAEWRHFSPRKPNCRLRSVYLF